MTPATFGPIACISRKFCGLACRPILLATRAAIGTADTPAAPISGLILPPLAQHISLPISSPAAVPTEKAIAPSARMPSVSRLRNDVADSLEPTASPRKIVTALMMSFWAERLSLSTTPHSRSRLPNVSMPISGTAVGRKIAVIASTVSGNRMRSSLPTGRSCCITTPRSFCVVSRRMIGGWMIGTSAMYE